MRTDYWGYVNTDLVINKGSLPENLPGDDSLALVILGQGLKADGSMSGMSCPMLHKKLATGPKAFPRQRRARFRAWLRTP